MMACNGSSVIVPAKSIDIVAANSDVDSIAQFTLVATLVPCTAGWDMSRKSLREKRVLLLLWAAMLSRGG
jgi:hypothetical protein